ncbi:MAG TPA: MarR family transcriptional regulator [Pseudonocardia sp.]|nr:MarR family transcriptional regulator [Pseudonocardia sp.]
MTRTWEVARHQEVPAAGRADEVEAVMAAARLLVAMSARSIAEVDDLVTLPQLRVLVMVASRGPLNLGAVARGLGVHPSNATRACDRLVAAGLLDRREDPTDRRNLLLEPTRQGRSLVDRVMGHRRAAISAVLDRMPDAQRRALVPALAAFAAAGGEVPGPDVWALGWTTTSTNGTDTDGTGG